MGLVAVPSPGPVSRRANPFGCSGGNPLATWRTIAMISCTISPRAPPVATLSKYPTAARISALSGRQIVSDVGSLPQAGVMKSYIDLPFLALIVLLCISKIVTN